ncbi:MAG: mandelate racemase/muconate lactonizing enzyme family protein [Verrucomicrobia bacterium]|nr:mandelate racemase/muconate lactonizing enzyme family protein [Verrucomicrobiota bacterium]
MNIISGLRAAIMVRSEQVEWAGGVMRRRHAVLVRVESDDGRIGWGEIGEVYFDPELYVNLVNQRVAPLLNGRSFDNPAALEPFLQAALISLGYTGMVCAIISGIKLAFYNLLAPPVSEPIDVPVYLSAGFSRDLGALKDECRQAMAGGFTAIKIRGLLGIARDVERMTATRQTVGDGIGLILELNQPYVPTPYSFPDVVAICEQMQTLDPLWIEEPFGADDLDAYQALHRINPGVPIGCGENLYTGRQFREFAEVVDVLQPDLARMGGVDALERVAASGKPLAPHQLGASVALWTLIRAFGHRPEIMMIELDRFTNPLRDLIFGRPLIPENGRLRTPPADLSRLNEFHWG